MGRLFYGTMTGNTVAVAEGIRDALGDLVESVCCIDKVGPEDLLACDFLILGGSTWGDGELTDDWADFLPRLDSIDLSGKTVALFALGDQIGYTYNFVSAMRLLYDKVVSRGARVIARAMPLEGYDFAHSEAVVDGAFVGLVIDEMNQPEQTDARIRVWAEVVARELSPAMTAGSH